MLERHMAHARDIVERHNNNNAVKISPPSRLARPQSHGTAAGGKGIKI